MLKVYLAGPIAGKSWEEATGWRNWFGSKFDNIEFLSPLRGKEYLEKETSIQGSYEGKVLSSARGLTTRDRWDCVRADVVIVNFLGAEKVSIGTVMEIAWADLGRKPIILIMSEDSIHNHPMIRESVGYVVSSLDEAAYVLEHLAA